MKYILFITTFFLLISNIYALQEPFIKNYIIDPNIKENIEEIMSINCEENKYIIYKTQREDFIFLDTKNNLNLISNNLAQKLIETYIHENKLKTFKFEDTYPKAITQELENIQNLLDNFHLIQIDEITTHTNLTKQRITNIIGDLNYITKETNELTKTSKEIENCNKNIEINIKINNIIDKYSQIDEKLKELESSISWLKSRVNNTALTENEKNAFKDLIKDIETYKYLNDEIKNIQNIKKELEIEENNLTIYAYVSEWEQRKNRAEFLEEYLKKKSGISSEEMYKKINLEYLNHIKFSEFKTNYSKLIQNYENKEYKNAINNIKVLDSIAIEILSKNNTENHEEEVEEIKRDYRLYIYLILGIIGIIIILKIIEHKRKRKKNDFDQNIEIEF